MIMLENGRKSTRNENPARYKSIIFFWFDCTMQATCLSRQASKRLVWIRFYNNFYSVFEMGLALSDDVQGAPIIKWYWRILYCRRDSVVEPHLPNYKDRYWTFILISRMFERRMWSLDPASWIWTWRPRTSLRDCPPSKGSRLDDVLPPCHVMAVDCFSTETQDLSCASGLLITFSISMLASRSCH